MTKEEAISMLYGMRADNLNLDDAYTKDKYEALDMAIKALEQEPCEDCIDRQAAVDIVKDMHDLTRSDVLFEAVKRLKELPSMTPQPKTGHWIPVSERLPENESRVLVTIQTPMRSKVRSGMFDNERFYNDNNTIVVF